MPRESPDLAWWEWCQESLPEGSGSQREVSGQSTGEEQAYGGEEWIVCVACEV